MDFKIDINCDVGEGVGNEAALLPLISSCNIACGGHAGTVESMTNVALLAKENNVKIGAHPSYPDKANFGRQSMNIELLALKESLRDQLKVFSSILYENRLKLNHIKPHGALYNDLATNDDLAVFFLETIKAYKKEVFLYVPYASQIASKAIEQNFKIKYEAFGDRKYNSDLTLVSRKLPRAVIKSPEEVLQQLLSIIQKNEVEPLGGPVVSLSADTFCIHGDTSNALQILAYLSKELPNHNIEISNA